MRVRVRVRVSVRLDLRIEYCRLYVPITYQQKHMKVDPVYPLHT